MAGANPSSGFYLIQRPFTGSVYNGSAAGAASTVYANKCTPSSGDMRHIANQPDSEAGVNSILQAARRLAALNGESNPTDVTYVATSRAKANSLLGATVEGDQAVYVVQLHGQFNGATASHPAGLPIPKGNVMTVTIDAANGQITDWGISNSAAPLNRLGAVRTAD